MGTEGIALFRDIVICVLGVITIAVLILIAVLAISLYRRGQHLVDKVDLLCQKVCQKANSVLDNFEATADTMRGIVVDIREEVTNPVAQIIAVVQGIRQGINLVNKFFKKEEEQKNE